MKKYDKLLNDLAPRPFNKKGVIWVVFLVVVIIAGLIAYIDQVIKGQEVTNLRDYVLWGVYISNFVYFVATSFVGAIGVAILRLTRKEWRTPIVRIAEIITLSAIIMAGITIMIDMARPDRILNLFIHARFQSPITWDVFIIPTFMVVALLLLFFPLIPDFALLKNYFKNTKPKWSKWYGYFSMNWKGNPQQKSILNNSIKIVATLIIPTGIILQTIDAWLFSTTYRVGWDSSSFAPYFIAGAAVAGVGALVAVIYIVRKAQGLEEYITEFHFEKMGRLLALSCMIYLYFNVNEYFLPMLTAKKDEALHLETLFVGHYSFLFWAVTVLGLIIPIIVLLFKKGRKPKTMFVISLIVVVTSWWKRYVIVTPTLLHPFLPIQGVPESWREYFPSLHEWLITFATLAMALLIITLLVRYLPVVPIQRTADENEQIENSKNLKS